ncbi:MAG TPA: hypothetical protein VL020_04950 [Pseudomonadales bacterium]|nr:hypothetical protein [Pseudomonadales bacterium]
MNQYKYTHTDMSGHKTVKVLNIWGLIWEFHLFTREKVEIELL